MSTRGRIGSSSATARSRSPWTKATRPPPKRDQTRSCVPWSVSAISITSFTRAFASTHGADVLEVGVGISHQVVAERGRALPGDLVIGADSHTVTCGALDLFAKYGSTQWTKIGEYTVERRLLVK